MSNIVQVETLDLKTFNQLYNVKIRRTMPIEKVHQQLESVFTFQCGIVETDRNRALSKVLTDLNEYIINIENVFYLVVRNNEN